MRGGGEEVMRCGTEQGVKQHPDTEQGEQGPGSQKIMTSFPNMTSAPEGREDREEDF